jgi:hypothetical protein
VSGRDPMPFRWSVRLACVIVPNVSDLPSNPDDSSSAPGDSPSAELPPQETASALRRLVRRRAVWALAAVVVVVVAVLIVGSQGSRGPDIEESCGDVNERFRGDLAFGESFGTDDLGALRERIDVVEDLRRQADEAIPPEDRDRPGGEWLDELDAFVAEMQGFQDLYENLQMGQDMLVPMTMNVVDDAAIAAGEAASRYGLETCADVDTWVFFPESDR